MTLPSPSVTEVQVILFGAGSGLADLLSMLPAGIAVVGVCDNDVTKQGTLAHGYTVCGAELLVRTPYDFVVVTNRKGEEIRAQLVENGIPREKILIFYPGFDASLRAHANRDIALLNRHLRIGLHPLSLCTMQLWQDQHADLPSAEDDFCRVMSIRLAADRIHERRIPGDVAELGVYRGELAALLNGLLPDRRLYLFDTFEGFSANDLLVDQERSRSSVGDFSDTSLDLVLSRMPNPHQVTVRKGYFPETAVDLEAQFALVSIDVDLYKPIVAGLEYFYPRLSVGGYLFIHDYNNRRFGGVRSAVDEFCTARQIPVVQLPDLAGSVVIAK